MIVCDARTVCLLSTLTMIQVKSRKWKAPTSLLVCGASGSGKTFFTANLIANKNKIFDPPPKNVIYFFKIWQEIYDTMKTSCPEIRFIDTPPSSFEGFRDLVESYKKDGVLVIFDDFEDDMVRDSSLYTRLYTVLSHHGNMTIVSLMHNIFRKELRTLSLNIHRLVLMRSPRDVSQVAYLSRQCFPATKNFLNSIYNDVMSYTGFPYLVVNFAPHGDDGGHLKVSTRIFESEYPMEVFKEQRKSGIPYEKLVLVNADLYKHLVESNHSVTNMSQTVNNGNSKLENSSTSSSIPPPAPLSLPPVDNSPSRESLGTIRRRDEGVSDDEENESLPPLPSSQGSDSRKIIKKSMMTTVNPNEKSSDSTVGETRKRKAPGSRKLPDRKARKIMDYTVWGV